MAVNPLSTGWLIEICLGSIVLSNVLCSLLTFVFAHSCRTKDDVCVYVPRYISVLWILWWFVWKLAGCCIFFYTAKTGFLFFFFTAKTGLQHNDYLNRDISRPVLKGLSHIPSPTCSHATQMKHIYMTETAHLCKHLEMMITPPAQGLWMNWVYLWQKNSLTQQMILVVTKTYGGIPTYCEAAFPNWVDHLYVT